MNYFYRKLRIGIIPVVLLFIVLSCSGSVWGRGDLGERVAEAYSGWTAARRDNHKILNPKDLQILEEVATYIINNYVEEVSGEDLLLAAKEASLEEHDDPTVVGDWELVRTGIDGMLSLLDDYSVFFDDEENRLFDDSLKGEFGGIGIEIAKHDLGVEVQRVLPNTPADKAGMKAHDVIIEADNKRFEGLKVRDIVLTLRGKMGTYVSLDLLRKEEQAGDEKVITMRIRREVIMQPSVSGEWIDENMLIKIGDFSQRTSKEMNETISELLDTGQPRGVILDLRGNRGGSFLQSVLVSDYFLDYGTIVFTEDRNKKRYYSNGRTPDRSGKVPMVVLIDKNSASASEIVAGAMRDRNRAVLVGNRSYGKGSVQNKYRLSRGMGLKITTQNYYTPLGNSVNEGITPDVKVNDEPEVEGDEQLDTALEVLERLSAYDGEEVGA